MSATFCLAKQSFATLTKFSYNRNAKDVNMLTEYAQKSRSAHDEFYSKLYCALWHESLQNSEEAKTFMLGEDPVFFHF